MIVPSTGVITEYPTPTTPSGPFGIGAGPDNTMWFTESSATANQVGVISGLDVPPQGSGSAGNGGNGTLPQAPVTGYGIHQFDPVYTFAVFSLVATSLLGVAFAVRKSCVKAPLSLIERKKFHRVDGA